MKKLQLEARLQRQVMDEETFIAKTRLAELVGAHWPYRNYNHYLAHEAHLRVRAEKYYRRLHPEEKQ
jgi:hypothetical protein